MTRPTLGRLAKAAYAFGGTTDIFGHWLYFGLMQPVFVGFLHLSPSLLGIAQAASRLVDGVTDSYFGWRSDNTRTRWGRRRPYILVGSLLAGAALPCLFLASRSWDTSTLFWFVLLTACAYAPILSCYNMPYQSLGAELSADTDERTTIMSWRGVVQTLAGVVNAWAWWFAARPWFADADGTPNLARGATWAGVVAGTVMILAGIGNVLFVRERYYPLARQQERVAFWATTRQTFRCSPFRILLLTMVLFAVPTSLVGVLGFYVLYYYVLAGSPATAAFYGGLAGTSYSILGAAAIPFSAWLAAKVGKGRALRWALYGGALGLAASFVLYTPAAPMLSVLCHGLFGIVASGFFWVLLPSMLADVVDFDELESGQRREGAFASTLSYVLKLGTTVTLLGAGPLVELTGFDARRALQDPSTVTGLRILFALVPAVAALLAALALRRYPLTRATMNDIRARLEARRGVV
ncbi:MAG: MFS transporter [Deltaproteobacteria bacterium]|nr:MFS transporter [Deltaproteobacteria bacterium]